MGRLSVYLDVPRTCCVRDVWRQLQLSSPSLAQYHVNKLLHDDLIKTTVYGKYEINDDLQIEALRNFVVFKGKLIPHLVVYGAIIAGLFISMSSSIPSDGIFEI